MVKYKNELKQLVKVARVGRSWKVKPGETVDLPEGVKLDIRTRNGVKCSLTKVVEPTTPAASPKKEKKAATPRKRRKWGGGPSDESS